MFRILVWSKVWVIKFKNPEWTVPILSGRLPSVNWFWLYAVKNWVAPCFNFWSSRKINLQGQPGVLQELQLTSRLQRLVPMEKIAALILWYHIYAELPPWIPPCPHTTLKPRGILKLELAGLHITTLSEIILWVFVCLDGLNFRRRRQSTVIFSGLWYIKRFPLAWCIFNWYLFHWTLKTCISFFIF